MTTRIERERLKLALVHARIALTNLEEVRRTVDYRVLALHHEQADETLATILGVAAADVGSAVEALADLH